MEANFKMNMMLALLLIVLHSEPGVADSDIKITDLSVPANPARYTNQTLSCNYQMGTDKLYAIKWYHNGNEFYKYVKEEEPPKEDVGLANGYTNVNINLEESTINTVVLTEVDLSASGEYKCEVNGDYPHFKKVSKSLNMTVVVIPSDEPNIEGVEGRYGVGDTVDLNCTAAPSSPAASMSWIVNNDQAPDEYLRYYDQTKVEDGLLVSSLGLKFKLKASHFIDGLLKLKCTATVATQEKSYEHSQQDPKAIVKEVREPPEEGSLVIAGVDGSPGSDTGAGCVASLSDALSFALVLRLLLFSRQFLR